MNKRESNCVIKKSNLWFCFIAIEKGKQIRTSENEYKNQMKHKDSKNNNKTQTHKQI